MCFCGSAALAIGMKGRLDLYHEKDDGRASLSWRGPWIQDWNYFRVTVHTENYSVTASDYHRKGILGDVFVTVTQAAH